MNSRAEILNLLSGRRIEGQPAFSGLIHVTAAGLESEGLAFHQVHRDAGKMAKAAASTFRLTAMPSAAVPLDLYVEAEALGADIDFRENAQFEFPSIKKALFQSAGDIRVDGLDILKRGRISLVCDAIRMLKNDIGGEAVIGAWTPGPFTLMTLLVEPARLFLEMKREPELVRSALQKLSSFLAEVGRAYRSAGADMLTVHDMGGSPAFIGPVRFEQFVLPAIDDLLARLPSPRVLSICGNTNSSMLLLAHTQAEALSVDQTNDLASSRQALDKRILLFGNVDPVAALSLGSEADVRQAVARARASGVDAVWPGCDLPVQTPPQNLRALAA